MAINEQTKMQVFSSSGLGVLLCQCLWEYIICNLIFLMNQHISSDRLIAHHRSREDYEESPSNTLQFAYGDHRYTKMTYELLR
jgi:hypothetical protein